MLPAEGKTDTFILISEYQLHHTTFHFLSAHCCLKYVRFGKPYMDALAKRKCIWEGPLKETLSKTHEIVLENVESPFKKLLSCSSLL